MIRLHLKKGLLGEAIEPVSLPGDRGITPRVVLEQFRAKLPQSTPVQIAVNGQVVDGAALDVVVPDGSDVIVLPEMHDPFGLGVLGIVILIVANAAIAYVAMLLAPRPKAPGVPQERGDDTSSAYSWDGVKTNYGPGLPIPWVYGWHLVGGQGLWTDVLASRSSGQAAIDDRLRVVLSLCEGPVRRIGDKLAGSLNAMGGIVGGPAGPQLPAGIQVNGNLIEHTQQFPGAFAWIRPGTQDQPSLPAPFTGVRQAFTPQAPLNDLNDEHIFTVNEDIDITSLSLVFSFPGGIYVQSATGALSGASVQLRAFIRPVGATAWSNFFPINAGNTNAAVIGATAVTANALISQFLGSVPLPWSTPGQTVIRGPLEVRVVRQSASGGQFAVTQATWRDLVIASPHTLRYPLEALLALELAAGARFSGGLPQISVPVEGALVRVWDATNGWSPRCWDVPAAPFNFNTYPPGRNPAWCLLDFLLARWGLGRWLIEADIDLSAFRAWAAFCDEDPDPDEPWGEAAFCVDVVGDQPRSAWEWVLLFCSAGRATPIMQDGKISIVYQYRDAHGDAGVTIPAKEPLQLITAGNCEDLQVNWISKANRPTVYQFQFLDEAQRWTQDVFPVEDDEGNLNDPSALDKDQWRPEVVQAFGITRKSQLFREGRWRHRIQRLVRRELTFTTGPWALAARVGDLISVQHEVLRPFADDVPIAMQVKVGGDATTTVVVDHRLVGVGLQVVVRGADGKPQRANISSFVNSSGSDVPFSTLTLATAVTVAAGAPCAVGLVDKLTNDYELVSVPLRKDLKREVRAVQWTPEAYDPVTQESFEGGAGEDDAGDLIDTTDVDELPPNVLGIRVVPAIDGDHRVTFARPASKVGTWARVYVRPEDLGVWMLAGSTELDEVLARGLRIGTRYVVSVCLENRRGDPVAPELGDQLTFTPEEFPPFNPTKVTTARANLFDEQVLIEWNDMAQRDLAYFEIRCGSSWPVAPVVARTRAARAVLDNPPAGPPFLIAVRSRSGLYGPIVQITNPNWTPNPLTLVQELGENDLTPSPAGTHSDTVWNSTDNVIELAAGKLTGTYTSLEQDVGYQAPRYWQVRIDRQEFEDVPNSELTFLNGSGEARWRLSSGRPASSAEPGLSWSVRNLDLAGVLNCDLPDHLMARGYLGVVGSHTRVFLESRFEVDGVWTAYAPHLDREVVARKIQIRLTLGRRALKYRARVRQLAYHAFL